MCMKETTEGCILLERMTKVETKLNVSIFAIIAVFAVLVIIAFKLLNTQIYLLTGGEGLRSVTNASRGDAQTIRIISGGTGPSGKTVSE